MSDNYRIYWPDLVDYSNHEFTRIEPLVQHGIACGGPFEIHHADKIVATWTPTEGLVYKNQPIKTEESK